MPAVLVGIIVALVNGTSIGAALAALTLTDWLTLAGGIASAVIPEIVAKKLGLAHPSLMSLIEDVGKGVTADLAAQAAKDWFTYNGDEAIKREPGISTES